MRSQTFDLGAYRFMRAEAPYCYDPAIETAEQGLVHCALALARAEQALRSQPDVWVEWEPDLDGTAIGEHPAWGCVLYRDRDDCVEAVCSLWGVDAAPHHPYRRVVAAELALEAGLGDQPDRRRATDGP